MENKKKRSLLQKLTDKYRLLIIDEDTFEHKLDLSLNRLNVFLILGSMAVLLVTGTIFLIASTSLKEYIPGYPSADLKKKLYELTLENDSLGNIVQRQENYLNVLRKIMTGEVSADSIRPEQIKKIVYHPDSLDLAPSREDSLLRREVRRKEKYAGKGIRTDFAFLPPARGIISKHFDLAHKHYGTDIVLDRNTPVKAIADGYVIFSGWSSSDGYILVIQHPGFFISVYKHNKKLYKQTGDRVKAGEVIAASGNKGENTTGPHLHFELWRNGKPVNPEDYIDFKPVR